MFQKLSSLVRINIFIVIYTIGSLSAQDKSENIFIISERIGDKIDPDERSYYQLFPDVRGFQSAVFHQWPDSSLSVKIRYQEDGTGKINLQKLSELEMKGIRESIDHFEEIQIGLYKSGLERFTLQVKPVEISDTPLPLNPLKIFGEFLFGAAGSMGVGVLGLYFGYEGSEGSEDTKGNWRTSGLGFLIGSTIGSALGVHLIGCWGDETGNLLDTFLGSVVGTALCAGIIFASSSGDEEVDIKDYYAYIVPAQTIGAIYAFNRTRRLERTEQRNVLFYYKDSEWSVSCPEICIKQHPLWTGDWIQTVNLLTIDF